MNNDEKLINFIDNSYKKFSSYIEYNSGIFYNKCYKAILQLISGKKNTILNSANNIIKNLEFEDLFKNINLNIDNLAKELINILSNKLSDLYDDCFSNICNIYSFTNNTSNIDINENWSGILFKDRITFNLEKLKFSLRDIIYSEINKKSSNKIIGSKIIKPIVSSNKAYIRLSNNEAVYFQNKSIVNACSLNYIEKLKVTSILDNRTCEDCKHKNGITTDIYTMEKGVDMPPFHIGCRCYLMPFISISI